MRNYFKVSLLFVLTIFLVGGIQASDWKNDPESCPSSYQSQTCSGSELVCGYYSDVTYCYDMSGVSAPAGTLTTHSTSYSASYDGGYLIDCHAYDGSAPHCDNSGAMWCDRDSACYNIGRITQCEAGKWSGDASDTTCTTCRTDGNDHFYCDGSYTDADGCEIRVGDSCGSGTGTVDSSETCVSGVGNCTSSSRLDCDDSDGDGNTETCNGGNGCEVIDGGSCSIGVLDGTYSGCTCVVDKSYFETGTNVSYSTNSTQHFLWGNDFGEGWLMKLFHIGDGYSFDVNSTGAYWNGTSLLGGGSGDNESWNESYADTLYADIGITGDNVDWNKTYADTLYAGIQWAYNQTIATFNLYNSTWDNSFMNIWNYNQTVATFNNYNSTWDQGYLDKWNYNQSTATYNMYNDVWLSTYNATYDASSGDNVTWNQTHADTLYAGIEWNYNQSTATYDMYNDDWTTTYNATYDAGLATNHTSIVFDLWNSTWDQSWLEIFGYNHTADVFALWNSTWDNSYMNQWNYNQSTATYNMYNDDWTTTYNATYDAFVEMDYTNLALINETNVFAEEQNFSDGINLLDEDLICLNIACSRWIKSNGSGTYIQG